MRRPFARSVMTTTGNYPRGTVLQVDTGPDAEVVKVVRCVGGAPTDPLFELTVRPVTWLDRARARAWTCLRRPFRFARVWWYDRCDQRYCSRRYAVVDSEYDGWCWRHADDALNEWMETAPGEGEDE